MTDQLRWTAHRQTCGGWYVARTGEYFTQQTAFYFQCPAEAYQVRDQLNEEDEEI